MKWVLSHTRLGDKAEEEHRVLKISQLFLPVLVVMEGTRMPDGKVAILTKARYQGTLDL